MKRLILLAFLFSLACQQQRVVAQSSSELPRVTAIENDRVHTLLAPDAIPSIDEPKFVRASEATFMDDDEPVVGVAIGGVAKTYSTWHLDHRGKELVLGLEVDGHHAAVPLDALGRRPILLTSALDRPIVVTRRAAYDRRMGKRTLTFEPSGAGHIRDRETGSSWSVETGEAIGGPLQGQRLTRISAKTMYWAIWAKFHPESEIVNP